jgi:ABC-type multidrug transport system fused ATPase/permease subunit
MYREAMQSGEGGVRPRFKRMGWEPDQGPRTLRRFPGLVAGAAQLLWRAAPGLVLLLAGLELLSAAAGAGSLLVVRDLVTRLLAADSAHAGFGAVVPELVVLAAVLSVTGLASSVQNSIRMLLSERVNWVTSEKVLDVSTAAELEAFDSSTFHDLLQRAQNAGGRPYMLTQALMGMAGSAAGLVGLLVVLLVMNPLLVPALLVGVAPLVLVATTFSREYHLFNVMFTENQRRSGYVRVLLTGREMAKEVRVFGLVEHLRDLNRRLFEERLADLRGLVRRGAGRSLLGSLGSAVAVGVTVGIVLWFVLSGRMTIAAAAAAAIAIVQVGGMLTGLAFQVGQLYENALFLNDHQTFLDLLPGIRRAIPVGAAPSTFEALTVEGVSFTYPDSERPALSDVSLRVGRGEVVALVGENGSGKTTLAKLLCQLYRPQAGRVLWDGVDLATVDPALLRRSIAVVFQDFPQYLFDAATNIGLGRVEAMDDRERILGAARQAGAHEFLEQLPQGYGTMLGKIFEGGADLSTGQWQRMALARAFFRDAPFIILDEPTAALDARAEHDLFESIRTLFEGRTVLLISHRFSSVLSADRIFVLRSGRLVEEGTHGELMTLGGHYAELFTLQAGAYLEERGGASP